MAKNPNTINLKKMIKQEEDTITILNKFIDNIKTKELDSNKLKSILSSLYNEAINLDTI